MPTSLPASFTVTPLQMPSAHAVEMSTRGARLFLWAAVVITATYLFEGPTRYVLLLAHVPSLIYLRDLAAVALVGFAISSWMGGERRLFPLVVAVYALFLHLLCGMLLL